PRAHVQGEGSSGSGSRASPARWARTPPTSGAGPRAEPGRGDRLLEVRAAIGAGRGLLPTHGPGEPGSLRDRGPAGDPARRRLGGPQPDPWLLPEGPYLRPAAGRADQLHRGDGGHGLRELHVHLGHPGRGGRPSRPLRGGPAAPGRGRDHGGEAVVFRGGSVLTKKRLGTAASAPAALLEVREQSETDRRQIDGGDGLELG